MSHSLPFGDGEGIGVGRVAVDHRHDVRPLTEEIDVHGRLARGPARPFDDAAVRVDKHDILRGDAALVHLRRRDEDDALLQLPREVAAIPRHILLGRQLMTNAHEHLDLGRVFGVETHRDRSTFGSAIA
ncbi:MAG: hypothetical protein R3A10_16850 [Caldilineaceae bacterium]